MQQLDEKGLGDPLAKFHRSGGLRAAAGGCEFELKWPGILCTRRTAMSCGAAASTRWSPATQSPPALTNLEGERPMPSTHAIVAAHGQDIHEHLEANFHWEIFEFLGELLPVVYRLVSG